MRDDMDHLLARLAARGPGGSLDGFEEDVLRGIARRREDMRTSRAMSSYRIVSVGLALAIGVTAGGMAAATTATQSRQVSPFSTAAHLAPSTLLEGGR
jgi:hypothetical protein